MGQLSETAWGNTTRLSNHFHETCQILRWRWSEYTAANRTITRPKNKKHGVGQIVIWFSGHPSMESIFALFAVLTTRLNDINNNISPKSAFLQAIVYAHTPIFFFFFLNQACMLHLKSDGVV